MALKISLKPNERTIIGGAIIRNGRTKTDFIIENKVPILREKDIISEEEADSPCLRIYFIIQLMYVDESNLKLYHKRYWQEVQDILAAAPSMLKFVDPISDHILHTHYYQALKLTKELIEYEKEMLDVQ
jgi:flagellar biosynthesis repressor protein FlbT